jgi:hypothetical protein
MSEAFNPEVWQTWPFPRVNIVGYKLNGTPRLDSYGEGWCDGFDLALQMADHFHKTGEWVVPARSSDLLGGQQP